MKKFTRTIWRTSTDFLWPCAGTRYLTQETFFRALEHIGQFRGECTLRVWLCQIAKHAWLTHCRRQRRREPEPELREEGPEERLAEKETAMEVHQVLHSLPEPYREVFALRVLGSCPSGR